jgi:protein-disulfide isomerase
LAAPVPVEAGVTLVKHLRYALGGALFALLAVLPAQGAQFNADQKTEIGTIVREYLLAHPEVLRDAITELDDREKVAEADARRKALADLGGKLATGPDSLVIGNPNGNVTLVEFFDYNCGYCKRALDDMARLMKGDKDLRVVLRDFPILSAPSLDAALVALAAHNQFTGDKFWEYHRRLLGEHSPVGRQQALDLAKSMGADMGQLERDAADPKTRAAIQQSLNEAQALALNGTPSYVVGDEAVIGAQGFDELSKRIANVRKCGKAMCS